MKDSVDLLAPFLVDLFNRSLSTGSVPSVFKAAYVTPPTAKSWLSVVRCVCEENIVF